MTPSQIIRHLRLTLGLEQHEFAKIFDVSFGTVSNWETGRRTPRLPKIRKMIELAKQNKIKLSVQEFLN